MRSTVQGDDGVDKSALSVCVPACAAVLAAFTAAAPAQPPALAALRVYGEVQRERGGEPAVLNEGEAAHSGDRLRTGVVGHVGLQLAPAGNLMLGAESELWVHSLEPGDPPSHAGLARLVLVQGTLRADARAQPPLPPADLRINVGALRLRVFGADAWIGRASDGDEVCVLAGAVELQTPEGPQRLDTPGHCLRAGRGGLQPFDATADGTLAVRLAHTAFPGDPAARIPGAAPWRPTPSVAARAADSQPAPSATVGVAWTIVLASLPDASRAEQEARRLRAIAADARVVAAPRDGGSITYRVVSGHYASKAAAAADLRVLRAQHGLARAWIAPLP